MTSATVERDLRTGHPLWRDSYGLNLALHPLRAPIAVDVAVVGAGVSGAFMAHALAGDFTVAILDRNPPLTGSTMASTAMLQWELDRPLTALSDQIGEAKARRVYRRSRAALDDLTALVRAERLRCAFEAKRTLYLAGDAFGHRALKAEAEARAQIGLDSTYVGPAELRAQFGLERTGAIVSGGSASADPARLAAGLLRRAQVRGAKLLSPVEVTGLLQGRDHVVVANDCGIEITARHVVFCCGYEFPKGVPTDGAEIVSTWALATQPVADAPAWLKTHLVWEASDPYLYFRTTADGRLVVGGEDEDDGARHADPEALRAKPRTILKKLGQLLPGLKLDARYTWAGAFGSSTTGMPLIGPLPGQPRCYAVMGLGGNGITYSVIASQVVGAAIRGRIDPDADLYRIG